MHRRLSQRPSKCLRSLILFVVGAPDEFSGGYAAEVSSAQRSRPARIDAERSANLAAGSHKGERVLRVYAIVRCGGRQEKASVDDVLTVDKLAGEVGSSIMLPAVLVVDDGNVISDPAVLGGYQVTAEIVGAASGPKINMIHYKNKTGYRRRLGHRQKYTQVKITGISTGKARASSGKKG
jgi:large subunit ribosomal protein L21